MQIGRLDRKITIESVTETRDSVGQPVETWATFATTWAQKKDGSGGESTKADQTIAELGSTFITRHVSGVTPKMRINEGGSIYDILSVSEIGRAAGLEIKTRLVL
jgi:SPP1 family predicted phage head-tail adaptor